MLATPSKIMKFDMPISEKQQQHKVLGIRTFHSDLQLGVRQLFPLENPNPTICQTKYLSWAISVLLGGFGHFFV